MGVREGVPESPISDGSYYCASSRRCYQGKCEQEMWGKLSNVQMEEVNRVLFRRRRVRFWELEVGKNWRWGEQRGRIRHIHLTRLWVVDELHGGKYDSRCTVAKFLQIQDGSHL